MAGDDAARPAASRRGAEGQGGLRAWLDERRARSGGSVERIDLGALDGWSLTPDGSFAHASGVFFRVRGAALTGPGPVGRWTQPLIDQLEVGTLGLLVAPIDGQVQVLVQAKLEPGSPGLVQLAPTFQATYSNASRLHRGREPAFADWFLRGRGRVVREAVLPELGAQFSHKRNRNVIVEGDVEAIGTPPPDFRWASLAELRELVRARDCVNMPARSVLALVPEGDDHRREDPALDHGEHSLADLRAWFGGCSRSLVAKLEPRSLVELRGWTLRDGALGDEGGRFWSLIGVRVVAPRREVGSWSQPLIAGAREGLAALLVQRRAGRDHVLVEARFEPGLGASLGPTICADAGEHCPWERRAPELRAWVDDAPDEDVVLDQRQAREGGRYWRTTHRYRVVRLAEGVELPPSPTRRWLTPAQLRWFLIHAKAVHLDARELLAMLGPTSAWVTS